jgi:hypothetical protein
MLISGIEPYRRHSQSILAKRTISSAQINDWLCLLQLSCRDRRRDRFVLLTPSIARVHLSAQDLQQRPKNSLGTSSKLIELRRNKWAGEAVSKPAWEARLNWFGE